jgi:hypothetical protein
MNSRTIAELRAELRRRRAAIFSAVAGFEADLTAITEAREAEEEE